MKVKEESVADLCFDSSGIDLHGGERRERCWSAWDCVVATWQMDQKSRPSCRKFFFLLLSCVFLVNVWVNVSVWHSVSISISIWQCLFQIRTRSSNAVGFKERLITPSPKMPISTIVCLTKWWRRHQMAPLFLLLIPTAFRHSKTGDRTAYISGRLCLSLSSFLRWIVGYVSCFLCLFLFLMFVYFFFVFPF